MKKIKTVNEQVLQVHVQFLHPDYIISVAVESKPGFITCYYKTSIAISAYDINKTIQKGRVLSEEKARELFNLSDYKYLKSPEIKANI